MLELFSLNEIHDTAERLRTDPRDWQAYEALARALEAHNGHQAYLCYENALFYCEDSLRRAMLQGHMERLRGQGLAVPPAAIVILNYNLLEDLRNCIESIRATTPETARQIVVVDNNSTDGSVEWMQTQPDIRLRRNTENSGFPKGCNQGVELADEDADIFLLNNDTIMCLNSLFWLRMGLYERESIGAAGCVTNRAGNSQIVFEAGLDMDAYHAYALRNNVPAANYLEEKAYLVGFALLIRRSAMNVVGLLDERFSPGNYEDNDYGLRMVCAGFENVLVHNSFLIHLGSKSFLKRADYTKIVLRNAKFFDAIYGAHFHHFMHLDGAFGTAVELTGQLPQGAAVLGMNCEAGTELLRLKWTRPDLRVEGLTKNPGGGRIASRYHSVRVSYYHDPGHFPENPVRYDLAVLQTKGLQASELPEYLRYLKAHLKPGGKLMVLVANRNHFNYWLPALLRGETLHDVYNEGPTGEEVRDAMQAAGLPLRQWFFYFTFPTERAELVEKIALERGGDKNDLYIRDHLLLAEME